MGWTSLGSEIGPRPPGRSNLEMEIYTRFLGSTLIAASLTIMLIQINSPSLLYTSMSMESWFVLAAMLSPIGYVLQDVVTDAMTVEAAT